jgi:hypothetical protein
MEMTVNRFRYILTLAFILISLGGAQAQSYSESWEDSNSAPPIDTSSEYTLGWQDTQSLAPAVAPASVESAVVEAPVAVNLAALPALIASSAPAISLEPALEIAAASDLVSSFSYQPRALRGPSRVSVPTHDITLHAERYYDYYADNYRYVSKVEVVVWRGNTSYPGTDTYENYSQYSTYDVYINDLKVGDRYEVRVTWDDGKYRILERSVGRYPDHHVRVSSPG